MTPQEAQEARRLALQDVALGLGRLSSFEVDPSSATASGILYSYQARLRQIEQAEESAGQHRHRETEAAAAFQRDQAGRFQPHAPALARGEATAQPMTEQERIQQTMESFAQRGLGRI